MPNSLSLLYIEDDQGLAELLKRRLERQGYRIAIAPDGAAGLEQCAATAFHAILLDYRLPDYDALTLLPLLAKYAVPVIILTALGDEKTAVEAMHAGAADYILKDINQSYLDLLPLVIQAAITRFDLFEKTRQQQESLRESEERFRLILQQVKDYAIFAMDTDKRPTSWNSGVKQVLEFDEEEFIGQNIVEQIFTPEDIESGIMEHEFAMAAETGRAGDDRWMRRKSGSRFWASGVTSSLHNSGGQLIGYVKIMRDYTIQRETENALSAALERANAANLAKSEFLANMSHEIRTPMNAVIGLSAILAGSEGLSAKQKEYVSTLQLSADSLLSLINDLLDISKIEARSIELESIEFSMAQLLEEVTSMMSVRAHEKGLDFTAHNECAPHHSFIGDPMRLRQIILNLCGNAIKFTEKGSVRVSISSHPGSDETHKNVIVSVADTGIGIAPDKQESIFDKFVQADSSINRKYGGTGLGLAITKTLAEIMGGTIAVESAPGKGAIFTLCLPMQLADHREQAAPAPVIESPPQPATHGHILLVEDYAPNVLVAGTFLEMYGYGYDVATNGHEALEKARSGNYTAALMDVQMHGMNGFEATGLIRAHEKAHGLPRLHIIGMTAHALMGDRERCLAADMDDYMSKPFNPDELRDKLAGLGKSG